MKKVVGLLFVAGLFLAACGNSATSTKESKSTKQEIAVSTPGDYLHSIVPNIPMSTVQI